MKRSMVLILSALIAASTLSAQMGPGGPPAGPLGTTATITKVEGSLALVNGMIAIKTKDKTYYLQGLQHLIGFIDGLKEGSAVKVEGFAQSQSLAPEYAALFLTKLTFNGRDFDLSQVGGRGRGFDQRGGPGGGMMGGNGGGMRGGPGGRG